MVEANHRKLLLYAQNAKDFFEFLHFARLAQNEALVHAEYRFKSFARVRKNKNSVHFIIDGEDYFKAVAEGIERAQSQLMITGWYISPEFQLMRPLSRHREKRLDLLLKGAADRNVKVFVLVYNESSFLHNDSAYVK
jgi:phospholipase D1/2